MTDIVIRVGMYKVGQIVDVHEIAFPAGEDELQMAPATDDVILMPPRLTDTLLLPSAATDTM